MPKYGTSLGKQTYRCGDGKHRYTPEGNRHYYSEQVKSQSARLYSGGRQQLGHRAGIGGAAGDGLFLDSKKAAAARETLNLAR